MPGKFNGLHGIALMATMFYGMALALMGYLHYHVASGVFAFGGALILGFLWMWATMRTAAIRKAAEEAQLQQYQQTPQQYQQTPQQYQQTPQPPQQ